MAPTSPHIIRPTSHRVASPRRTLWSPRIQSSAVIEMGVWGSFATASSPVRLPVPSWGGLLLSASWLSAGLFLLKQTSDPSRHRMCLSFSAAMAFFG
jgi:hypothetical protein